MRRRLRLPLATGGLRTASAGAVIAAVLAAVPAAAAQAPLSLSVSHPAIEGAPITFTASGMAPPADSLGDSTAFLIGAVIPQNRPCPAGGADDSGDVPGTVLQTLRGFPVGSFQVSNRVAPTASVDSDPRDVGGEDLLAGDWRECVYLQDRFTNRVDAAAQADFTVRRARVSVRVVRAPRHVRFRFNPLTGWNATVRFVVRASSEVGLRTLQVGVEEPGERRPCAADMHTARVGMSSLYRMRPGPARTYHVSTPLDFSSQAPYGRRVRVCAVVAFTDPLSGNQVLERAATPTLVIRR